jgi:hypothetical protein
MTPDKVFSLMMGKHKHEHRKLYNGGPGSICKICNDVYFTQWSPSHDGKLISHEVMDFMAEKFPEAWDDYLNSQYQKSNDNPSMTNVLNAQLSISNLYDYIVDNQEIFWEECPNVEIGKMLAPKDDHSQCVKCKGTGKFIKKEFEKVVEYLEENKN